MLSGFQISSRAFHCQRTLTQVYKKRSFAIFSLNRGKTYRAAASVVTALTCGAIGGCGGMTSPHLLDTHLLFNGMDTVDESTQPEANFLRKLFATIIIIMIMITMIIIWKVEGGKHEKGKLNDLEHIPEKKHNTVANRNRNRNIDNNKITPSTSVDVLAHNNETISSSDTDINGNNNDSDVDIVLSHHEIPGVSINCNNYHNGYNSNNESLIVYGADLELNRNYTFTNTIANASNTETRSKKMKLTLKSTYQSGLNTIKENSNINILSVDIDAGYEPEPSHIDYRNRQTSQGVSQGISVGISMGVGDGITGAVIDDNTRPLSMHGIGTVTVIISGSNNNGNDSGVKSVRDVGISIAAMQQPLVT